MVWVPEKTVARLSLYRRLLYELLQENQLYIFSHDLARLAGGTAAQVRRDVMALGVIGNPNRGYAVQELIDRIGDVLDAPEGESVALIGVGNLGRAILSYFTGRRPKLVITAAFDNDMAKVNRVIHGCRVYPLEQLEEIMAAQNIRVVILAVPANQAQSAADLAIRAGARGLLNFAPVPLHTPAHVFVEDNDITTSLEKVAYFARRFDANSFAQGA